MGDTDLLKENCVIMTEDYYYNTDWKCVEERDSGESCPRKQYVYGIRGRNDLIERDNYRYNSSSGSPSCSSAGKERHYALTDAMGSVTAVASTSGTVAERYSYTAFGQSQVMTTSFANRSMSLYDWQTRFHGEQRDEETGYYNYGYRYYLPELGKWPSRDPIVERGGLNLYGFVENNGINELDVLGMFSSAKDICDCLTFFLWTGTKGSGVAGGPGGFFSHDQRMDLPADGAKFPGYEIGTFGAHNYDLGVSSMWKSGCGKEKEEAIGCYKSSSDEEDHPTLDVSWSSDQRNAKGWRMTDNTRTISPGGVIVEYIKGENQLGQPQQAKRMHLSPVPPMKHLEVGGKMTLVLSVSYKGQNAICLSRTYTIASKENAPLKPFSGRGKRP
jgi:RHS repeat-associated protein